MLTLSSPSALQRLLDEPIRRRPLQAGVPVVVYGAGRTGKRVIRELRSRGFNVVCVLDQRASTGQIVEATPVHVPGAEPLDAADRAKTTAVVAVFNRDADSHAIEELLRARGYRRTVGFLELHDLFSDSRGADYWLSTRDHSSRHADAVLDGYRLLADAASRSLYEQIIAYRREADSSLAPRPMSGVQYFPADVPRARGPLRYVDCGAYDGDTLAAAIAEGLESACAFEPDPANFSALSRWAAAHRAAAELYLWPCAVSARTEMLRFAGEDGEASRLSAEGGTIVQSVSLDDALPGYPATDLKMDIEGAEMDALSGAGGLIARCRPRLAICVYHRPEHLWTLSARIAELGLAYSFYLRAHAHGGFDVVLYAVPSEQCGT